MPYGFPCPNPACPHVFQADSVRRSSALTCPSCGHVFHFRQKSNSPRQSPGSEGSPKPVQTSSKATAARPQNIGVSSNQSTPKATSAVQTVEERKVAVATPVAPAAPPALEPTDRSPLVFEARPLG